MAITLVLVTLFYWTERLNRHSYRKILTALIIVVSVSTGIYVQTASYFNDAEGRDGGKIAIERQKYGPVFQWLRENGRKEAVVLGNNETSHLTVIYTSLNVFHHRSAQLFLAATEDRLLDAMFTFYRLRRVSAENARKVIFTDRASISSNIYGIYYRELLGSYEAIPDEKLESIIALYQETFTTRDWLQQILNKYEVEYVVWDQTEDPLWQLDQYMFLKKVADFDTMKIYAFVSEEK